MDKIKLMYHWLMNIEDGGNLVTAVLIPNDMLEILHYFIVIKWLHNLG
jgi:hypothetical protein